MPSPADDAIRAYLHALKDSSSLRDAARIANLQSQIGSSTDPLDRLRLRVELDNAENVTAEQYEAEFIEHAKAWADGQGIGVSAFATEGVPKDVLRRAGFRVARGRGPVAAKRAGSGTRKARVSSEDIRAGIPKRGTFTAKDVADASGASLGAVRSVLAAEIEAGRVTNKGPSKDHGGPGRAPILYKRG